MAMDIPDPTRNASISQYGPKHLSHNPEDPNPQNSFDLCSPPNATGIHVSPFHLTAGENTQPGIHSSFEHSLFSNPALHASLPEETATLETGYSCGEGLLPGSTRQDPSSIHLGPKEEITNTSTLSQLLQASQSIQLPNQIQNGHQSQHASRMAFHNGYRTCQQSSFPIQGLTGPFPPMHLEKRQHVYGSHAVEYTAQGFRQSQVFGRHPLQDNGFGMPGDQNQNHFAGSQPQQIPVVGGSFAINHEQIAFQQLQFARSQYLWHPGQIYDNVSGQTQLPFSPSAMNSHVNANINDNLNKTNIPESVADILPLVAPSNTTHQPVPIRPAASATTPVQDTPTRPAPIATTATQNTTPTLPQIVQYHFDCHLCGKGFRCRKGLRRHFARMHILKSRHPCLNPGCTQSFAEAHKLKRHFRTVHLKSRPFKCPDCDCAFGERGNMNQHHRKAHGAESKKVKRLKRG